jgi:hypothetical protein
MWQKIGTTADRRVFVDLKKVPQVFRNPGGSPALQNEKPIQAVFSRRAIFNVIGWK